VWHDHIDPDDRTRISLELGLSTRCTEIASTASSPVHARTHTHTRARTHFNCHTDTDQNATHLRARSRSTAQAADVARTQIDQRIELPCDRAITIPRQRNATRFSPKCASAPTCTRSRSTAHRQTRRALSARYVSKRRSHLTQRRLMHPLPTIQLHAPPEQLHLHITRQTHHHTARDRQL
jgi:hypothetical protein